MLLLSLHPPELAAILIVRVGRHGVIRGHAYNDKNDFLYEHPDANPLCRRADPSISVPATDPSPIASTPQ